MPAANTPPLTPLLLLNAYCQGIFPMADSRDGNVINWYQPEQRGIIPIKHAHIPHRLARTVRSDVFTITIDTCFTDVMRACAAPRPGHPDTWISDAIIDCYSALQQQNYAHSVEVWQNGKLAGGLYGVAIGGGFFGESMFSLARDASKVALVHLLARLDHQGYQLCDTQFITPHLAQFGAIEIPCDDYLALLAGALGADCSFGEATLPPSAVSRYLQSTTHTS